VTDLAEPQTDSGEPVGTTRSTPSAWLSWAGVVAGGFTALCCLGVSAALSLAGALGATFFTRDSALRPLLAASLAVTVVGSALAYWRHRHPSRLVVTTVAAVWVYAFIYLVSSGHGGGLGDHMNDAMTHHGAAFTGGRLVAVWLGLAALVGTQAWDLVEIRLARRRNQSRAGLLTLMPIGREDQP
jgi:hypothetical protein